MRLPNGERPGLGRGGAMTHSCRVHRRALDWHCCTRSFALQLFTQELYVCIYGTTIRYECDDYFSTLFEGGGEGYAEAVSSLVMHRAFLSV
jgi:hypothetical protein